MDIRKVKKLIELMEESDISEIDCLLYTSDAADE